MNKWRLSQNSNLFITTSKNYHNKLTIAKNHMKYLKGKILGQTLFNDTKCNLRNSFYHTQIRYRDKIFLIIIII